MNLSDALINLSTQTVILAFALASMAFRIKGNYKAHLGAITVAVILGITVAVFGSTFVFSSGNMQGYTGSLGNLAVFVSHGFFGIASFASGIILIALLLMDKAIAARSGLIAKVATALWVVAYIVGIVFLLVLHII